jgi:hypothetical protein
VTALLRPTSELVGVGWLTLALPGVGIGTSLPAADDAMRAAGFVRVAVVGGHPDVYTPRRGPVVVAECWVPPANGSHLPPWQRAGHLAQTLVDATQDRALEDVVIDVTGLPLDGVLLPGYAPARVMTVIALGEPRRVEGDPNYWARSELDLSFAWLPAT